MFYNKSSNKITMKTASLLKCSLLTLRYVSLPATMHAFSRANHSQPHLRLHRKARFLQVIGARQEKQSQKQVELRSGTWKCQNLVRSEKTDLRMGGSQKISTVARYIKFKPGQVRYQSLWVKSENKLGRDIGIGQLKALRST